MLRVYFKKEIEKDEKNFSKTTGRADNVNTFYGMEVFQDKGSYYTSSFELIDEIPDHIAKHVEFVTYYDNFGVGLLSPKREIGIYGDDESYPNATARVYTVGSSHYHIKLRGKTLEDLRDFHGAILGGTVRPVESHEGKQSGKSKKDLEDEVEYHIGENQKWSVIYDKMNSELKQREETILMLAKNRDRLTAFLNTKKGLIRVKTIKKVILQTFGLDQEPEKQESVL